MSLTMNALNPERRVELRMKRPRIAVLCTPLASHMDRANVAHALIDVSTGGARLILTERLAAGEPVLLDFTHEESSYSVSIPAEIRWVVALSGVDGASVGFVTGVRFRSTHGVLPLLLRA